MVNKFLSNRFVRNVATVFTGTALAQLLPLAAAPVLTRLYSPEEFGVYALYLSVITMGGIAATGRYEMAINLPRQEEEAFSVLSLACLAALISCCLMAVATPFIQAPLSSLLGGSNASIYLIPLGALAFAGFRSFNYWTIYRARFRGLAAGKVIQAGGITGLQVGTGTASISGGLLIGQVTGSVLGAVYLFISSVRQDLYLARTVSRRGLMRLAVQFRKFPLLSLPADFANTLTGQLPILILGAFFGSSVVGLFALTQRVLGAPLALLGVSVQDVFKERASREYRENGSCRDIYLKTLGALAGLAILPFVALFILAPALFEFVFGDDWRIAGDYARIMIPLFFLRFVASPLSYVLYIAEKQQYDLVWQLCLLGITAAALLLGSRSDDPGVGIAYYAGGYSFMYLIYLWMSFKFTERPQA